jgi:hypothetical protein
MDRTQNPAVLGTMGVRPPPRHHLQFTDYMCFSCDPREIISRYAVFGDYLLATQFVSMTYARALKTKDFKIATGFLLPRLGDHVPCRL